MVVMALALIGALPGEIVVNGRRLSDYRQRLEACVARRCPAGEDIAATLAAAEIAFLAGRTRTARSLLYASIARNRRYALDVPDGVASLYRAYSNVQRNLGDADDYRYAAWGAYLTYRDAASAPDAKQLEARIDLAAMQVDLRQPHDALDTLTAASREAAARNLPAIAAFADLQRARLLHGFGRSGAADKLLADLAERLGKDIAYVRLAARLTRFRYAHPGRTPDIAMLAADPDGLPEGGPRLLIWSPPSNADVVRSGSGTEGQWADVAFHVRPDGRVEDVHMLQSSSGEAEPWVRSKMANVAEWLYTPVAKERAPWEGDRVYHFGYTSYSGTMAKDYSYFTSGFASRLPRRAGIVHLEALDISAASQEQD